MADIDTAIVDAKQRATRYQDIDGLPFLAFSAYALFTGSSWLLQHPFRLDLALLAFVVYVLFGLPDGPVILWLKSRITYPRTGFVALPQPNSVGTSEIPKKRKMLKQAAFGAFFLSVAVASYYEPRDWMGAIALSVGIALVGVAHRDEPRFRFVWFCIPGLWLSAWMEAVWSLSPADKNACFWFAIGILSLIVGATQLVRYLHRHPKPLV